MIKTLFSCKSGKPFLLVTLKKHISFFGHDKVQFFYKKPQIMLLLEEYHNKKDDMAKKTARFGHNPGMIMFFSYIILAIANAIVLYFAQRWFPQDIVLGTAHLTEMWAIKLSMGKLALINVFAIPFFREWEERRGKMLGQKERLVGYFLVNFVGLWLISRWANIFGLGVTSWTVVAGLALAMNVVQGAGMIWLEKWRTNQ
jgi:hypothetical protein